MGNETKQQVIIAQTSEKVWFCLLMARLLANNCITAPCQLFLLHAWKSYLVMMRKMQHFYIISRLVSQCVYMSSGEAVRALEGPPLEATHDGFCCLGHKIEEMLFRTFVFASVLNDAQSLLSSLQHSYTKLTQIFCLFGDLRFLFFLFAARDPHKWRSPFPWDRLTQRKVLLFGYFSLLLPCPSTKETYNIKRNQA